MPGARSSVVAGFEENGGEEMEVDEEVVEDMEEKDWDWERGNEEGGKETLLLLFPLPSSSMAKLVRGVVPGPLIVAVAVDREAVLTSELVLALPTPSSPLFIPPPPTPLPLLSSAPSLSF